VGAVLSPVPRVLLWDFQRGSLPYDVMCLLLLLLMFVIPPAFLADPMVMGP
jgi:hypothetical protein